MDFEAVRALVPRELGLQQRDGKAWIGLAPFRMSGVRLRGLPPLPGAASFPELNLRTYVAVEDVPGVYFFSLDAGSLPAVWTARALFGLPYSWARMRTARTGNAVSYASRRRGSGPSAELIARYEPRGDPFRALPGTLEHWLVERYCLYTVRDSRVRRLEIEHAPWTLRRARAAIERNTIAEASGLRLPSTDPLLHFAEALSVRFFWPETVGR
jgi:uncharacterized protein